MSQNYYPERLGKLYIINAPWGFGGIFSVVKRFLDPVTVAKIPCAELELPKRAIGTDTEGESADGVWRHVSMQGWLPTER